MLIGGEKSMAKGEMRNLYSAIAAERCMDLSRREGRATKRGNLHSNCGRMRFW